MTFLAPTALIASLVLVVPVLVHLFKPRKTRVVPFSSLRWLRPTHQRISRRIQWHQWLLFLMRAGVLLLLVLAMAKPILSSSGAGDRIVIVDVGRGMAGGWDKTLPAIDSLIRESRPGQRTAVIAADHDARLLQPLSLDASAGADTLRGIKPAGETDFRDALDLAKIVLEQNLNRSTEVVLVTTNPATAWPLASARALASTQPARVRVVETAKGAAVNAGIAAARLTSGPKRRLIVDVGVSGADEAKRTLRVAGISGMDEDAREIALRPGGFARVTAPLPEDVSLDGQIAQLRLEPGDAIADDDLFLLPLGNTGSRKVVVIEPAVPGGDGRPIGLFVRAALDSLIAAETASLDVVMRTPATASTDDIRKANIVLALGATEIPESLRDAIEARVRSGAGLIVWTGPNGSAEALARSWHRPLQPAESLIPMNPKIEPPFRPERPSVLHDIRRAHPILAGLRDPVLGDGLRGDFTRYVRFQSEPSKHDVVLARFQDGTPALVEHPLGGGRVLIVNSSANDDWTDFPRRQGFVPFLDRALDYLAGAERRTFAVGDTIAVALPILPENAAVRAEGPDGVAISPRLARHGNVTHVTLDDLRVPGIYRITHDRPPAKSEAVAVNVPFREEPAAMDAKTLADWFAPVGIDVVSLDDARPADNSGSLGRLWPLLIVMAGLLLIAETLYASWLCPRRQPALAVSILAGRTA